MGRRSARGRAGGGEERSVARRSTTLASSAKSPPAAEPCCAAGGNGGGGIAGASPLTRARNAATFGVASVGALAVAVGFGVAYWAAAALLESMGTAGLLPAFLAGWSPDAIFSFLAVYFFLRMPT